MNNWFKRNGVHCIIVALLIVLSFAYFFTPLLQGKSLSQSDVVQAQGMQKEIMDVKAKTGHAPLWTNAMFAGMPSYMIWVPYPNNITSYIIEALKAVFPNPVDTVLLYLLGAYLLFCVLRLNPWLAAAGAIAFAFSSYNFILIDAGHANQAYAICFFAPIIAGIILIIRGQYWIGGSITAFFLSMEIRSNHIQMTYYLLLAILVLLIVELVHAIRAKKLKLLGTALIYLVAATLLAVAVNASMLWTSAEYSKESNRGPSNLTQNTDEPSNGLDKPYAYGWSQGVGECFTFLVPNAYGGASGTSAFDIPNSAMTKAMVANGIQEDQAENFVAQGEGFGLSAYWGNKQFTGGPFYFGAIVCFLFVLGLLIVRHRIKWWLLATVVLTMLLSFGKNWPYVSDLFFNYFPMYNKFRSVESILAVAGLCFPVLALLAVQEIINTKDKALLFKQLLISLYITGGITVLLIVLPGLFLSFKTDQQQNIVSGLTQLFAANHVPDNVAANMANGIADGLVSDRKSLEQYDAIRSLIFILIAFGILWAFIKQKISATVTSVAFIFIVLIDMWGVDRRYLNDNNFVTKDNYAQPVAPSIIDQTIMRDTDRDYRVLDLSREGGPFNNAGTSFFHKSIGGYSAAKLKRYDELITNQFNQPVNGRVDPNDTLTYDREVLDMLNTKYIITADPRSQQISMHNYNQSACGNAWFVKTIKYVNNADQEMEAIKTINGFDPRNEAVVDKQYQSLINLPAEPGADATITLTHYAPDTMVYQSSCPSPEIAVFSEIYYKEGWKMLIDGQEQPYFRADYLLRAAQLPIGNHKVEFIFHPAAYYTGEDISLAGSVLLVLALGGALYAESKRKKPEPAPEKKPEAPKRPEPTVKKKH